MRIEYRETPMRNDPAHLECEKRRLFVVGTVEGKDAEVWICWIESYLGKVVMGVDDYVIDTSSGWNAPKLEFYANEGDICSFSSFEWSQLIEAAKMAWDAWKEKGW